MNKNDIRNLSYRELTQYLEKIGEKPFRGTQVFEWIYKKGVSSFDQMRNLPEGFRQRLQKDFSLPALKIVQEKTSKDGTKKFLFELHDHEKIEAVLIPTPTRTTVCISSQAGCKFGCRFCASGTGGWVRNLSCGEMVAQVLYIKEESRKHHKLLSHVVCMGMGEGFDNYANLMKAVRIMNATQGLHIGARRITVSTCGLIPQMRQFAKEGLQIELAVSLHGFDDASRSVLMPVNKKYPFDDLMKGCREYTRATKRQITFEYILIKDLTCSEKAARALGRSLKGMLCKMNLIPYNPVKECDCQGPTRQEIITFRNQLRKYGVHATIRVPRGSDVAAACGQLRQGCL